MIRQAVIPIRPMSTTQCDKKCPFAGLTYEGIPFCTLTRVKLEVGKDSKIRRTHACRDKEADFERMMSVVHAAEDVVRATDLLTNELQERILGLSIALSIYHERTP